MPTPSELLSQVADDFWEGLLQRDPVLATFYGDYRFNEKLPDASPAGREVEAESMRETLRRLEEIDPKDLSADELVTWDMMQVQASTSLEMSRLRLDEMGVDQMQGPQVWLGELFNWHPTDTEEHVDQLAARYRAFGAYMEQYLANLDDGVRDGRTSTVMAVERVVSQVKAQLATDPAASPFATPVTQIGGAAGERLLASVKEGVYPALERLLGYLEGDYLTKHARQEHGVWSVTDGDEIYALMARHHTTTNLTPQELHDIGLSDLAGIQAEMRAIMESLGDSSGDIRAFTERLTKDPENLPATREEIVSEAERYLALSYEALPKGFGHLAKTPCIVRQIEEFREQDSIAAFYYQPNADGSRPGVFYVNTYDPSSRPKHTLPALVFHEGVPGHHLQIAISQETEGLPAFRRLGSGMGSTSYVEGWGLYSERFAEELGLYDSDLARFGMLGYQAWRACRLVVDTGMHFLKWTRQEGIDFFLQNVGLTERETVNEADRYIIWPGQALAYKIGQREMERMRRELQAEMGSRFDLRAFHDELLGHGPVPLSTLEKTLRVWAGV